ncbi:hypothetical protein D3C87_1483690 [compost metagenome]
MHSPIIVQQIGFRNGLFEVIKQAIQVYGQDVGGVNGCEIIFVGKPATAEIPARFSRCPDMPEELVRRDAVLFLRLMREICVFAVRLRPWCSLVIPIAVQQRAVGQIYQTAVRCKRLTGILAAVHPVIVFLLHLGQVFFQNLFAFHFTEQPYHQ